MTEVTKPNLDSDPRPIPPWDNGHGRAPWVEHSIKTVFENPWLRIEETAVDAPTGKPCQYGLVRFKNRAIGILPIFDDGTTIIVGQMRYPLGNYSWEIPEGGVTELILALSNDVEGEATCHYLTEQLVATGRPVKVTRIGFGLPSGGGVLYADSVTLKSALDGRRTYS